MIAGTGVDLVEIGRIAELGERHGERFLRRVFTAAEIAHCSARPARYQHFAARFAVKEAVFKALGTGWTRGVAWRQVETTNDETGKPSVALSGVAKSLADGLAVRTIHVSISHTRRYAIAQVILET